MKTRGQRSEVRGQGAEDSKFESEPDWRFRNSKLSEGMALMLALWALFLLSVMVVSWALDINSRLTISGNANRALDAEAMACSGAEIALHPAVKPGSPLLNGGAGRGKTYEAHLTGEGGRLNVNWLVAGEVPARMDILRQYLTNKGIDLDERDRMIDSLLDWVEPDTGLHHLNAPPESDTYHPPHALLNRIDELKNVAGWGDFTSVPGWDDELTLNSSGPIDLMWAPRDVLLSLPGFTQDIVDRFLQLRAGPDGIEGTADDAQFGGLPDVQVVLGLNAEQFKQLNGLISLKDPVYRVVSIGKAGDATHTIQMVFRRVGILPQLITWKEF